MLERTTRAADALSSFFIEVNSSLPPQATAEASEVRLGSVEGITARTAPLKVLSPDRHAFHQVADQPDRTVLPPRTGFLRRTRRC